MRSENVSVGGNGNRSIEGGIRIVNGVIGGLRIGEGGVMRREVRFYGIFRLERRSRRSVFRDGKVTIWSVGINFEDLLMEVEGMAVFWRGWFSILDTEKKLFRDRDGRE